MKKLAYLSLALFIVACASKKTPPTVPATPSASKPTTLNQLVVLPEVTEATFTTTVKDFTFADYHKGKSLYESKCNGCHALIPPSAKPTAVWEKMVPVMVGKYNMKNTDYLDESAVKYISGYLVTVTTK